jgi:hypothetical protein
MYDTEGQANTCDDGAMSEGDPPGTPVQLGKRFARMIELIGDDGYQDKLPAFAKDLGAPVEGLRTCIQRAVELKLITVRTHSSYIGVGRLPNSYHLTFPVADWPARRERLVADQEKRLARKKLEADARRARKRQERINERAKLRAGYPKEKLPKRVWPPEAPKPMPPPKPAEVAVADLDVEAWLLEPGF